MRLGASSVEGAVEAAVQLRGPLTSQQQVGWGGAAFSNAQPLLTVHAAAWLSHVDWLLGMVPRAEVLHVCDEHQSSRLQKFWLGWTCLECTWMY